MNKILKDIEIEMASAKAKLPEDFENTNTRNDYIAYAVAYLGRAADKTFRNERENLDPREMLIKAAGLIIAAIESGK